MEINWFTVIAQFVNFFILVWLLKRFLYKPILKAIDERENKILAQLKEADIKKAEAEKEQEEFQQKNVKFDQDKKNRMDKVISETAEERQKMMDQSRKDAETLSKQLAIAEKEQQQNQHLLLSRKITEEVFAVSRKALTDLASVDLEEQLTKVFIKRLRNLKEKELEQLKDAFKETSDPLLVRSGFTLTNEQQKEMKDTLDKILGTSVSLNFEENSAMIGGVELSTLEYKLSWSISEYLHAFEKTISKTNHKKIISPVLKK